MQLKLKNSVKYKLILKNKIVRTRINIKNVLVDFSKLDTQLNYLIILPIDTMNSAQINFMRLQLKKYGFTLKKYLRGIFIKKLIKSKINLSQLNLSKVYFGQLLVLELRSLNYRSQIKFLTFLSNYFKPYILTKFLSFNYNLNVVNVNLFDSAVFLKRRSELISVSFIYEPILNFLYILIVVIINMLNILKIKAKDAKF